ncbi:MAG TPA: tRNA lysidine(34) synthetase TilS, partial [Chitinophagaceae bacterium]
AVHGMKEKLYRRDGDSVRIPVRKLMQLNNKAMLFEVLVDFHFSEKQVDELVKLASSDSGKYISSPDGCYRILKFRNWFIVSAISASPEEYVVIDNLPASTELVVSPTGRRWRVTIMKKEYGAADLAKEPVTSDRMTACLDANGIDLPLMIRRPKDGDYFYPLGMRKKKKVARFFIDQKLPLTEREAAHVVEMNKKIIWVAPFRIDDRFKVTSQTKAILEIRLEAM